MLLQLQHKIKIRLTASNLYRAAFNELVTITTTVAGVLAIVLVILYNRICTQLHASRYAIAFGQNHITSTGTINFP